ncbi:MAG: hypothetical protein JSU61_08020 [Fidelibacterota bacterium]|nr:MAG: hypothetical protein JSU61_08020 [Candidatus Neomarinimicrobiota bacterium]
MNKHFIFGFIVVSGLMPGIMNAGDGFLDPTQPVVSGFLRAAAVQNAAAPTQDSLGMLDVTHPDYKYPGRAMMMSLAVPGSGQLYVGSKVKAAAFLGIDLIALLTWNSNSKEGEERTLAYQDTADVHWDFMRWLITASHYQPPDWEGITIGTDGSHQLEFFVDMDDNGRPEVFGNTKEDSDRLYQLIAHPDSSDHIYVKKNHEYYENIGKYNQFFSGWDDADPYNPDIKEKKSGTMIARSPNRSVYLDMRAEANRFKQIASYAVSAVMFNHVVSAVDAIFSTSKWNQAHVSRLSGRVWYNPMNRYGIGGIRLSFAW